MRYDITSLAITFTAVVVVYAALARGLFRATEPARQSLIDLAGSLLDSPRFPSAERLFVERCLCDAYSARSAWVLAFTAIVVLLRTPFTAGKARRLVPTTLEKDHARFVDRWLIATIGNSPIAAVVFGNAMLLSLAIRFSLQGFANAVAQTRDHHGHSATA